MTEHQAVGVLPDNAAGLIDKGLAKGEGGTFSGAILGISSVAPGYALAASIGLIVAAVGFTMPAIFIAGFIPMFLAAYAYRELSSAAADGGASFTWSTKAFGPHVGFICGWGIVIATLNVLSILAAIAVEFFNLFLAKVLSNPGIADLANNKPVSLFTTLVFLASATAVAYRGITTREYLQIVLVVFQMVVLLLSAVLALVHVAQGNAPFDTSFSMSWFNSFSGLAMGGCLVGLTGSIFAFRGWDTCLSLGEECKDPEKPPVRAGLLCVTTILLTYLLLSVSAMLYAGVGATGLGLGNPETADNVFGALAGPVMGDWIGLLLFLAVLASWAASLQTTFLPVARTMLAMDAYRAFPTQLAEVHPRFLVPLHQRRRGRRGNRRLLHGDNDPVRVHPAGHHRRIGGHDLLVLQDHRIRVPLVLPAPAVPQCEERRVQVPVPTAGRTHAGSGLRHLREGEHGPGERQRGGDRWDRARRTSASCCCSVSSR